jgi:hypothetical protein
MFYNLTFHPFFVLIGIKYLQVHLSGYEDHQVPMVLVVWKYSTMDDGGQSVTIVGTYGMLGLYVVNLGMQMLLELFEGIVLMEQARYG